MTERDRATEHALILVRMEPADSYAAEVNRLLAAAVSLFPTEQQLVELQRDAAPAKDLPNGGSGLAAAAERAAQSYRNDDARAAGLSDALHCRLPFRVELPYEMSNDVGFDIADGKRSVVCRGAAKGG